MSQSSELTVRLSADLHARPAGQLVQTAAKFDASVSVEFGPLMVDARGVLTVMRLGAVAGDEVTLRATGPQADQALAALGSLLGTVGEMDARPSR